MQRIGFGVAGKLAQEVLIARGLAVIVVFVVEAWAGQRHVMGLGMPGLATSQFRAQRFDQPARTQNAREGMIALGAVQFEAKFAGQVDPDRHLLFFPWRGISFGQALDDLSLTINRGEVFGLLGPNGSGKSTTIKLLLGLIFPSRGSATVLGRAAGDTTVNEKIGFLPEESYLYRFLNGEEILRFYGKLFKIDRKTLNRRVPELLDIVGLDRTDPDSSDRQSPAPALRTHESVRGHEPHRRRHVHDDCRPKQ